MLITRRLNGCGEKKVCNCHVVIKSGNGCIIKTALSFACALNIPGHIWSVDFVHDKLSNGRSYKILTVLDEYTREAICVAAKTRMGHTEVLEILYPLFLRHGKPTYLRSDNGSEFIARDLQAWLNRVGIKPIQIYPGSPWENGYNERFNGTLRREVLNAEWFSTIKQAQIVINTWLKQYNYIRPHQALNMRPPMPEILRQVGTDRWG